MEDHPPEEGRDWRECSSVRGSAEEDKLLFGGTEKREDDWTEKRFSLM